MSDSVKHPEHYRLEGLKGVESIDIIKAVLGAEGFKKFCRGNALKYLIRADKKNGLEDLKKAAVYLNWEISGRTEEADDEKTAEAAEKKAEKAEAAGPSEEEYLWIKKVRSAMRRRAKKWNRNHPDNPTVGLHLRTRMLKKTDVHATDPKTGKAKKLCIGELKL